MAPAASLVCRVENTRCQGRTNGDISRLAVTDLTDHDDVRILTNDRPKTAGESQSALGPNGDLVDALEVILDRVFDGDDFFLGRIDLAKGAIERRRLATAGRAANKVDAVGTAQDFLESMVCLRRHAQPPQFHQ